MERLTYKDASGNWVVACNRFWNYLKLKFPAHIKGEAVDRLAAYENTGLEPEEILSATDMAKVACALHELNQYKDLVDLDRLRVMMNQQISLREEVHERFKLTGDIPLYRLRELVQADKDGRCVIIPDFVWKIGETQGVIKVPYKSWMGRFIGTKFYKTEKEAAEAALKGANP